MTEALCSCSLNMHFNKIVLPVFEAHNIVKDGVEGTVQVVEESRDMKKIFIDCPEELCMFEVDIDKTLGVEWSPADEESNHHSHWK